MKRVVVTGIGIISPIGNSLREAWEAALCGRSGVGPITRFDATGLKWKTAGELKGFDPGEFLTYKEIRRFDPFVHYAAAASAEAVTDAGLKEDDLSAAAVIVGSSRGGIGTIEDAAGSRPTAYLMSGTTVSMAASFISKKHGIKGPVLGISNACASGSNAIGEAMRAIKRGGVSVALAGGAEAPVTPLCVKGYGTAGALSKSNICRPFDAGRDGFVLGEGAAVLVLEELVHAKNRGASIYAEVAGYGNSSDALHETRPDPKGEAQAIEAALAEGGLGPDGIGYISAHGTGTRLGDRAEAVAARLALGERAGEVPASALKPLTGHMLGASGAFEAAMAIMALREQTVPPTLNLRDKDPECGLDVVREAREAGIRAALVNSFGFGGVNSVLVIKGV